MVKSDLKRSRANIFLHMFSKQTPNFNKLVHTLLLDDVSFFDLQQGVKGNIL